MKRIIGWFVDFLMPLILLLSYTLLERVISIKYQYVPVYEKEVPFEIISNFIIALYVILLCKRSFRRVKENSGISYRKYLGNTIGYYCFCYIVYSRD